MILTWSAAWSSATVTLGVHEGVIELSTPDGFMLTGAQAHAFATWLVSAMEQAKTAAADYRAQQDFARANAPVGEPDDDE
jgi:hypothetical protein